MNGSAEPRRAGRTIPIGLVRLFPAEWRARFGDEFAALLADTPFSFYAFVDVVAAALDAHLNPDTPRRWPPMNQRLRSSEIAVFASWIAFVVAGLGFRKMTEDPPYNDAAAANPVVAGAFALVIAGAVVALLAVLAGGVPLGLAIVRSALEQRRWRTLALLAVPPVSLAVWLGVSLALLQVHPAQELGVRLPFFLAWVGVFFVAAIASTVSVAAAAIRTDVDTTLYRRAALPAAVAAIAMAVTAMAVAVYGAALLVSDPTLFWGDNGMLATTTAWTWGALVAVMAVATAAAAVNARTALAERS